MFDKTLVENIALSAAIKNLSVYKQHLNYYVEDNFDSEVTRTLVKALAKTNELILLDLELRSVKGYEGLKYLEYLRDLSGYNIENISQYLDKLVELKNVGLLKRQYAQNILDIENSIPYEKVVENHKKVSTIQLNQFEKDTYDLDLEADYVFKQSLYNLKNGISITGVQTFYDKLDEVTAGFQKEEVTIIAGRPGASKTSLALSIIDNISIRADNRVHSMFFSAEMGKRAIMTRLYAAYVKTTYNKILQGRLNEIEWMRYRYAYNKVKNATNFLTVDKNPTPTPLYLKSKLNEISIKKSKPDIIFIDYLQLMKSDKKHGTEAEEFAYIAQSLKEISKEFNCHVVALSQLSRNVESRTDKRPILSDLRSSGGIEQAADLVIGLYRDEYYNIGQNSGLVELLLLKGRNLSVGTIYLSFLKEFMRFENLYY